MTDSTWLAIHINLSISTETLAVIAMGQLCDKLRFLGNASSLNLTLTLHPGPTSYGIPLLLHIELPFFIDMERLQNIL